jgi:hypothetical protein
VVCPKVCFLKAPTGENQILIIKKFCVELSTEAHKIWLFVEDKKGMLNLHSQE